MTGVQLVGHGGFDQLALRHDIPVPHPQADEVLIRVGASSVNNTDINTRTGWYSHDADAAHTSWSGQPMSFPRIQGADCCGRIVAAGSAVDPSRLGARVLIRTMQDPVM
ncbi:MAG: alcohol dehydrogenase catalytic domain-containing protein, partial [Actinomycetota bacterium]